jgi:hypothetical protein
MFRSFIKKYFFVIFCLFVSHYTGDIVYDDCSEHFQIENSHSIVLTKTKNISDKNKSFLRVSKVLISDQKTSNKILQYNINFGKITQTELFLKNSCLRI